MVILKLSAMTRSKRKNKSPRKRPRSGGNAEGDNSTQKQEKKGEADSPQYKNPRCEHLADTNSPSSNEPSSLENASNITTDMNECVMDGDGEQDIDEKSFRNRVLFMLGNMQTNMDSMKRQVEQVHDKLGVMELKLENNTQAIESMKGDIEQIKELNDTHSDRLNTLEESMEQTKHHIAQMSQVRDNAPRHLLALKFDMDKQEQHTRKESIRITGLKEETGRESEAELREKIVDMAKAAGIDMADKDISVCHRLGKVGNNGSRNVICKFLSRNTKHQLMRAKRNLKNNDTYKNIFINDDLTKLRARLYKLVREDPRVSSCHTRDGKIICVIRHNGRDRNAVIETPEDLFHYGWDVDSLNMRQLGLGDLTDPYSVDIK